MSSLKCLTIVLVCGLAAMSLQAAETRPASETTPAAVLLEKGIYTEETVGDLDAAIRIYQDIVEQAKAGRPLAAQAQYRLAMCYLKKGDKAKAATELQTLLATYPQEKEIVVKAQGELTKLTSVAPVHIDAQKVRSLMSLMDSTVGPMKGFKHAMEESDAATALPLARLGIGQMRELLRMVRGSRAEIPTKAALTTFESLEASLATNDIVEAQKLAQVLWSMTKVAGESIKSELEAQSIASADAALAKGLDAAKVRAQVDGLAALMAGVYRAAEQNDLDTALTLLRQEITQGRELLASLAGTAAEAPVRTALPMLERLEAALAAKDTAQVKKLMETLNAMGPVLGKSIMEALGKPRTLDVAKAKAQGKSMGTVLDALKKAVEQADTTTAIPLLQTLTSQCNDLLEMARGTAAEAPVKALLPVLEDVGTALKKNDTAQAGKLLSAFEDLGGAVDKAIKTSTPSAGAAKANLINWVEKFFSENYRDITSRKTIEWGEPETTAGGNLSIRYKYLATIWNKDKMVMEQRFTFTPAGEYVSAETIEKGPATQPKLEQDAGITDKGLLVGGGRSIEFVATADGIIYLYDHGKLIKTKSLKKGENVQWLGQIPISTGVTTGLSEDARLYFKADQTTPNLPAGQPAPR